MNNFAFSVSLAILLTFTKVNTEQYPPQELLDMLKPLREYCINEIGITEDDVENYVITNTDRKMKCYMACIMKQSNWMTMNGEIKYDFIISNPWEPIRDIIITNVGKCRNIEQIDDACDLIYNFAKCLYAVDTPHWFLP